MSEPQADAAREELDALLTPILAAVAELDLAQRTEEAAIQELEHEMERRFPYAGETVQRLGELIQLGVDQGWLCNRGEPDSRFSRLAKPSESTHQLSIDCVSMIGHAVDHTHTKGELTVGFAAREADDAAVRFEDRPPGWVFLPPMSRHRPHVTGGRMHLMYFLPEGAVQWHMDS